MLLLLSKMTYTALENKGKGVDEVHKRQRRQKITAIEEATKKALWFLDSFNIDISSVLLKSKASEYTLALTFSNESQPHESTSDFSATDDSLLISDLHDTSASSSGTSQTSSSQSFTSLSSTSLSSTSHSSSQSSLHSFPDKKVDEMLFLLDCFGVSDEFYHELSMFHPSLPRSHLVKQRRTEISSNIPIQRLPHPYFGCYRSLSNYLKEMLMTFVS